MADPNKKTEVVIKQMTTIQQTEYDRLPTISARIRYLDKEGFTRNQIALIINRKYQQVRNVLETPLKRTSK